MSEWRIRTDACHYKFILMSGSEFHGLVYYQPINKLDFFFAWIDQCINLIIVVQCSQIRYVYVYTQTLILEWYSIDFDSCFIHKLHAVHVVQHARQLRIFCEVIYPFTNNYSNVRTIKTKQLFSTANRYMVDTL